MSAHDYRVKKPFDMPKSNETQKSTAKKLKNKENRVYCHCRCRYKASCAVAHIVPCARDRRLKTRRKIRFHDACYRQLK
ncbi:predicted protein [Sclerotinia sclerotiorum 1980 UF-70]|uniref:Uncharacterized protein n=1 Tax=Sclerotinia sclerotiorum (strain ATCC 18683 / 1980 / Ss-1) TaxID=665079 RepID=A7EEL0_SCLS1|nr:predicted protein [Sclerotinia sclerotiorum 1980 UF-70]EDO01276.1 predicted protein [Sclerotinia sclerotiorum 1980 UF-70]